ncbi:tape measure protein [Hespellia stercorisuis]|uniref:Tape measure domain-containing protein n=1 Tax=Hespellia stercorisuis DSM 15480 TaxID=1121950 RepID=A0A1M6RGQ4_9FIRM|nr:tape measure protein [Hespellia stercorisuis]SHK31645.1 tape measure domain-containing protein [Hespellia stercorisuis DSM 15480]
MAESYSVKAILSAVDSGFSSVMKTASASADNLKSTVTSGLGFGVLMGVGQQAFSAITSGIGSMASEMNSSSAAWKTFTGNMEMNGKTPGEIKAIKNELQQFAQDTIYSSSDMASTFAQLEAVGTKDTLKLVKGFGGLAAAAENPKQAMKTLSTQATQMAAKPTVAWMDFKLMMEQTPAGISAVAKEMGMTSKELVAKVQDGTVATEDFFDAISRVGTNDAFTKLATEYKTVDQAMDGLQETVANKLAPAYDALSAIGIKAISGIVDKIGALDGEKISQKVMSTFNTISKYWNEFSGAIAKTGALQTLKEAFINFGDAAANVFKSLADSGALTAIGTVIGKIVSTVSKAVSAVSKFTSSLSPGTISSITGGLLALITGFKAFNFLKSFNPFGIFKSRATDAMDDVAKSTNRSKSTITKVFNGIANVIKSFVPVVKSAFSGISGVVKTAGTAISTAAKGIGTGLSTAFKGIGQALKIANPVSILAMGASIGVVIAAFALLATQGQGVASIIEAVGTAIATVITAVGGVVVGIIAALIPSAAEIAVLIQAVGVAFATSAPAIAALGTAMSAVATAIGEAVSQILTAVTPIVSIISDTFIQIAQIISDTIVGIIQAIAPFVPAILDAFTQCTQIISEAIVAIVEALAPFMPSLQEMVEATSQSIQAICESFTTLVSQISPIIESIKNLVKQLGDSITEIFGAISEVITSVGEVITSILSGIADIISSVGDAALNAGTGFNQLAQGIQIITELNLMDMATSLGAVALGIGEITAVSGGLSEAASALGAIASNAITAAASMGGIASSAAVVGSSLDTLESKAKSAMSGMISVFSNAVGRARAIGMQIGTGLSNSVQSGLGRLSSIASTAMGQFNAALQSGGSQAVAISYSTASAIISALGTASSGAYSCGYNIGAGLASGMSASLGEVRSMAAQLAEAAEAAIRAKAQIHSPSRVADKLGSYFGTGYVNGIASKVRDAAKAARDLVQIPSIPALDMELAYSGAGESRNLNGDYSYDRKMYIYLEAPVNIEGRQVAKASAAYTQEELQKMEKMKKYLRGEK